MKITLKTVYVPDEWWARLKSEAALAGKPVSSYMIELVDAARSGAPKKKPGRK